MMGIDYHDRRVLAWRFLHNPCVCGCPGHCDIAGHISALEKEAAEAALLAATTPESNIVKFRKKRFDDATDVDKARKGERARQVIPRAHSALKTLIQAKAYSDVGDYAMKQKLMRDLIRQRPHEFVIDSEGPGHPGITHVPTGFRMHLPRTSLPVILPSQQLASVAP